MRSWSLWETKIYEQFVNVAWRCLLFFIDVRVFNKLEEFQRHVCGNKHEIPLVKKKVQNVIVAVGSFELIQTLGNKEDNIIDNNTKEFQKVPHRTY